MKRFKQLRITLLAVVLAVSMLVGGASLTALAANLGISDAVNVIATATQLPQSVYLEDYISVNGAASVTKPDGSAATITDNKVQATQLGCYTITYGSGANKYEYKVNSTLQYEYELRVDNGGAIIPTVISNDKTFDYPAAAMYVKDKKTNEYKELDSAKYSYEIWLTSPSKTPEKQTGTTSPKLDVGTHTLQYVANLKSGGVALDKFYTKDFTIKSQVAFKDGVNPTCNVANIPTEASLKTKVELPKATAVDNFDKNVLVEIKVVKGDKEVLAVEVDDYGYATAEVTGKKQKIDNVYDSYFYPMELGTYTVTYQAFDDDGGKSIKHTHNISVVDNTAPRLEKIEDSKIPAKWSTNIKNKTGKVDAMPINFPFPEYSDNGGLDGVKVSFTITDTVNSKVVIKFANILDQAGNDSKYTYDAAKASTNGEYNASATFSKTSGFDFVLKNYVDKVADLTTVGEYTAVYEAKDAKGNTSSKSYTITVSDLVDDQEAPQITLDTEDYIYLTDSYKEYTMPTAFVTDAADSKPTVTYKVLDSNDSLIITIDNGAKVEIKDGSIKIAGDDDSKAVPFSSAALKLSVTAVDDVGNSYELPAKTIELVKASDFATNSPITLSINDDALNKTPAVAFTAGKTAMLGDLVVNSFTSAARKYAGFELSLTNPKGELINGLSLETYVKFTGNIGSTYIRNLEFTPSVKANATDGFYVLTVKAFDISGKSIIKSYNISVDAGTTGGTVISAAAISTTGDVNVSYKLKNETAKNIIVAPETAYVVRRISNAGKFSLMGIDFTAYTTGKYTFIDGYYADQAKQTANELTTLGASYSLSASQTSNAVFEVLGRMPTYSDKNTEVKLPKVMAHSEYENATIEIVVKNPSNTELSVGDTQDYEVEKLSTGEYKFTPKADGAYTITYTAVSKNSQEVTQSFTLNAGDVTAPTFTIIDDTKAYTSTMTQNKTFQFKKLNYDASNTDLLADATFTKQLLNSAGEVLYEVSGTGETGRDNQLKDDTSYTLSDTGTYTVKYIVKDKIKNAYELQETVIVTAAGGISPVPLKILRTVLIIVGVVLLAGVLLYFIRYRKVKTKSSK